MLTRWCFTGNIIGPQVFRAEDSPGYTLGFIVVVITSIIAAFLGLLYRFLSMWDNKKRDNFGVMEGFDDAFNDDSTDKKVCYSLLRSAYHHVEPRTNVHSLCRTHNSGTLFEVEELEVIRRIPCLLATSSFSSWRSIDQVSMVQGASCQVFKVETTAGDSTSGQDW